MTTFVGSPLDLAGRPAPIPGRVLGIDPGLNVTGYAVVDPGPRGGVVLEAGVLRAGRESAGLGRRLDVLYRGVLEILDAFPASAMALEQVHSHPKFPRTALLMSHARGAIMLAAEHRGVPVFGYAAARIKKSLTGSGRAPKEQMQHAIRTELALAALPEPHDVADACAVALCHLHAARNRRALDGR